MKRFLVLVTMLALLLAGCGGSEPTSVLSEATPGEEVIPTETSSVQEAAPDFSQATPGEEVLLTETLGFDVVPYAVVPYGRKPALALSSLELTQVGDRIDGRVSFAGQGQDDFTLVLYLSMPDELLVGYLDAEKNLTLHLPDGMVLFGTRGYELSGDNMGTLEFSLTAKVYSGYSVIGDSGTAYAFAVPGSVNPQSILPGDQNDPKTYQASSNVVEQDFDF